MLNERTVVVSYFSILILIGTLLLLLPGVWQGANKLTFVDALFTATSAVCVTGLIVVDTAQFSIFGKIILILLIEAGGLGLVTFFAFFLATPIRKFSIVSSSIIKDLFITELGTKPSKIIRKIVLTALIVETLGAIFLFLAFKSTGITDNLVLNSIFHAVSAFCNAGFSTFSNSLEQFNSVFSVNIIILLLIILGGIGFVVIQDFIQSLKNKTHLLTMHTKIVLLMTVLLIIGSALFFFIEEWHGAFKNLTVPQKIMAALFQSVTCRTAGFDTVPTVNFSKPSILLSILLMFIGASPGSTGGGIKTTTFFILTLMLLRRTYADGSLNVGNRKISAEMLTRVFVLFLRALLIICISFILLVFFERKHGLSIVQLFFEVISAFGTVGLSLNTTSLLSTMGKIIIISTMFMGRIGIFTMIINNAKDHQAKIFDVPDANILIG